MQSRLLIVYHSHGWRTEALASAAMAGAQTCLEIEVHCQRAAATSVDDLLAAHGYLFATPECFGGMSGMLKDLFERAYYPIGDRLAGRPYACVVVAGQDGQGAVQGIERIARGLGLKKVQEASIVPSDQIELNRQNCEELGATLAFGLTSGLF